MAKKDETEVTASPTNESFSASHQSNISTAATVEAAHSKADIMSIFEDLTQDDQDSIRLLAVKGCAALGKLLEPQDFASHIPPINYEFLSG
ncbi:unnamed protein product, partial [Vitis vinifera]|uniref:Uncharacterized protein n=1 Tax=Vitis vinifera TaxID=29760 RepID=D7SV77_VITVI